MLTIAIIIFIRRRLLERGYTPAIIRNMLKNRLRSAVPAFTRNMSLLLMLMLFTAFNVNAGNKWELKKNSDGIKIYTRSIEGSDIKEIKASFDTKGNIAQLEKLLLDISTQKDWVYSTKQSSVVKHINKSELIYYSEKTMPWPVTNRDAVIHVRVTSDLSKDILFLRASSVKDVVPEKKSIVRVPLSEVTWKVTAIDNNTLRIEYWAKADPGGTIPAWVSNMFLTKGPYETFVKLRQKLEAS